MVLLLKVKTWVLLANNTQMFGLCQEAMAGTILIVRKFIGLILLKKACQADLKTNPDYQNLCWSVQWWLLILKS